MSNLRDLKDRFEFFDGEYTVIETKSGAVAEGYYLLKDGKVQLTKEGGSKEPVIATYDVKEIRKANFYLNKAHRERATY